MLIGVHRTRVGGGRTVHGGGKASQCSEGAGGLGFHRWGGGHWPGWAVGRRRRVAGASSIGSKKRR